jgi:hypothetical protein
VVDRSLEPAIGTALKDVAAKEIGDPRLQHLLEDLFNHDTPESASLRKFTTSWTSEDPKDATARYWRTIKESLASAISKVPDVSAHENAKTSLTA